MRARHIMVFFVLLFVITVLKAGMNDFGFTGEFNEEASVKIPNFLLQNFELLGDTDGKTNKVVPLAIGVKKNFKPVNPMNPNFLYYSYNLLAYDQWWVGFIVVNFDDVEHLVDITMDVEGPLVSSITKTVKLDKHRVHLYSAKIKLANYIGLYSMTGKTEGEEVKTKKVNTRLYIYDVL